MLLALLTPCIDPVTYGAVASDSKPDTAAIQKAIDEAVSKHAEVCLGEGVWELEPPARQGKHGPIGSLLISGPVTIRGKGGKTVLRMVGDGDKRDWRGIHIKDAHDVSLVDFAIDGLGAYNTEEQTHLVEIGPDSHDITVSGMTFGPMRKPDEPIGKGIGGDGIRVLGNPGHEVEDVVIADSTFVDCDRSGIGLQRSVRRIAILRDKITGAGDQSIDFEPTGRGAIEDVAIIGVTIDKPAASQGAWAMTLVGNKDLAHRITVADSTIDGGAIMLMNVEDVDIRHNKITQGAQSKDATISWIRHGSNVTVRNNTITRPSTAQAGPLVRASHNNGAIPHGLVVTDNVLRQETHAAVVGSESVGGVVVRNNTIDYTGTDPIDAVVVSAVAGDLADVEVSGNTVSGNVKAVLDVASREHNVASIRVHANKGPKASVHCRGKAESFGAVVLDDKAAATVECKGVTVSKRVEPKK